MQYLVRTSGEVLNSQEKAYVIKASSGEEAQKLAKDRFAEEFCALGECVYVQPSKRTFKAWLAFVFMLVPILLSFVGWKVGHDTVLIRPDYMSCLYAVLLYGAFVVRFKGVMRTVGSWIDIIFCVLNVLLISSFVQTLLVTKTIKLFWVKDVSINTAILIPVAVLLSWLGLKLVSVLCMAAVGILALVNITTLSSAMGSLYGPVYIICAFLGILLYLAVEPAAMEILPHFRKSVQKGASYMRSDVVQAGKEAGKLGNRMNGGRKES